MFASIVPIRRRVADIRRAGPAETGPVAHHDAEKRGRPGRDSLGALSRGPHAGDAHRHAGSQQGTPSCDGGSGLPQRTTP